jgi:hypothetical protein
MATFKLSALSDDECQKMYLHASTLFQSFSPIERRKWANLPSLFIFNFYFILFILFHFIYFISFYLFYLVADDDDEPSKPLEPKTKSKPIARKTSSSDMSPEVRRHLSKFMK